MADINLGNTVILTDPYDNDLDWKVTFIEGDKVYLYREDDTHGVQTMVAHRSLLEIDRIEPLS